MAHPTALPPSTTFAKRLRATREARGFSRPQLARRMTEAGRPLSKLALLKIESGERKVSLDEALALAQILYIAPAHLLSPPEGEVVWLTEEMGLDGDGLRHWLLTGQPIPAWPTTPRQEDIASLSLILQGALTVYATALVDASRGGDKAGAQAAANAIAATVDRHRQALQQIERGARKEAEDGK